MRRIRERDSELPITESVQANARGSLTEKVVQVSPGKVALLVGESEGWCQGTRGGWVPSVGPLPAFSLDIHLTPGSSNFSAKSVLPVGIRKIGLKAKLKVPNRRRAWLRGQS